MLKSELYCVALTAVLNMPDLDDETKLETLKLLLDERDMARIMEDREGGC